MTFEEDLIREVSANPILWNKQCEDYKNRQKGDRVWSDIAKILNKPKNEIKNKWRNLRDVFQKESKKVREPRDKGVDSSNELNYTGKWIYYPQMLFLRKHATGRSSLSSQDSNDNYNYNDESRDNRYVTESETRSSKVDDSYVESSGKTDDSQCSSSDESLDVQHKITTQRSLSEASDNERQAKKRKSNVDCAKFHKEMLEIEREKMKAMREKEEDDDVLFAKSLAPYFRHLSPVRKLRLRSKLQNVIAEELNLSISQGYQNIDNAMAAYNPHQPGVVGRWVGAKEPLLLTP